MLACTALTVLLVWLASALADPAELKAARPEQRAKDDCKDEEFVSFITNNAPKDEYYKNKSKYSNQFTVYGLAEGTYHPTVLASVEPGQSAVYKLSRKKYAAYAYLYQGRFLSAYYSDTLAADRLAKEGFWAIETLLNPAKTPSGSYDYQMLTDFLQKGEGPKYPVVNWSRR